MCLGAKEGERTMNEFPVLLYTVPEGIQTSLLCLRLKVALWLYGLPEDKTDNGDRSFLIQ